MLCLLDAFDNVLIQPFMPNRSVIALNIGILLRLAWLDMLDGDVTFFRPFQELATDGIRQAQIAMSTIHAIAFRKTKFKDALEELPELYKTGIYEKLF